mmetsp:Transcript_114491/g.255488  ORF Transcript_114491/g.255488 Transcript_114491/m.255488 type:complete len:189 (+) Transcript_114491:66-632(+)
MARTQLLPLALVALATYMAVNVFSPSAFLAPGSVSGRREAVLGGAAGAVSAATLGVPAAWADAQGEPARALAKYGPKVLALKDAVASGDCEAILKNENKFKLLNGFWRNAPVAYKKQSSLSESLLDAADAGKKDEMKDLYAQYISDPTLVSFAKYPPPTGYHIINVNAMSAGDVRNTRPEINGFSENR